MNQYQINYIFRKSVYKSEKKLYKLCNKHDLVYEFSINRIQLIQFTFFQLLFNNICILYSQQPHAITKSVASLCRRHNNIKKNVDINPRRGQLKIQGHHEFLFFCNLLKLCSES